MRPRDRGMRAGRGGRGPETQCHLSCETAASAEHADKKYLDLGFCKRKGILLAALRGSL